MLTRIPESVNATAMESVLMINVNAMKGTSSAIVVYQRTNLMKFRLSNKMLLRSLRRVLISLAPMQTKKYR